LAHVGDGPAAGGFVTPSGAQVFLICSTAVASNSSMALRI
jgi:hypothetical protein